jgi:hypothetical protein
MQNTEIKRVRDALGQIYYDIDHLDVSEYSALYWYHNFPLQVTLDGQYELAELQRLVAHMEQIEKAGRDADN